MPRSLAPKPNEQLPTVRAGSAAGGTRPSRRLAAGTAALVLVGVGLLSGCGNAVERQRSDTRPEPNASTEGMRSVFPSAAPPSAQPSATPLPGPTEGANPSVEPPRGGENTTGN